MNKKLNELDVLSGIAIIFVVLIHTNIVASETFINLRINRYYIVFSNFLNLSVPIFLFVSGIKYQIIEKNYSYRKFIKKKSKVVLKPFLILSGGYLCILYVTKPLISHLIPINSFSIIEYNFRNLFYNIINIFLCQGKYYNLAYQLWYIPMFMTVVVIYPYLYRIFSNKIRFIILLLIAIILNALHVKHPFDFISYLYIYDFGNLFYCYFKDKKLRYGLIILAIILIIINFNYNNLLNLIGMKAIFTISCLVLLYEIAKRLKDNNILLYIGNYSFYIFLFHEPFGINFISEILIKLNLYHSYFVSLLVGGNAILFSIIIYKLLCTLNIKKFVL